MVMLTESLVHAITTSVAGRETAREPYTHWHLHEVLPGATVERVLDLPFEPQQVGDVSGKRELHNATRKYFDAETNAQYDVCGAIAAAFQDPIVVGSLARAFDVDLDGTCLRIEYAADTDGFWLEPHTDLGVKRLTFLYYMSREPGQEDLGTDIYWSKERHWGRAPFVSNSALVFVPASDTWHGFERRPIKGIRKSLIINYVTREWRAREQLAFPDAPVVAG